MKIERDRPKRQQGFRRAQARPGQAGRKGVSQRDEDHDAAGHGHEGRGAAPAKRIPDHETSDRVGHRDRHPSGGHVGLTSPLGLDCSEQGDEESHDDSHADTMIARKEMPNSGRPIDPRISHPLRQAPSPS